jgi:CMP/dCMP kinase
MVSRFSIVISGWPAVGKTTIAGNLAEEFGLILYNGGDILKMLAAEIGYHTDRPDWWDTDEAKKFMLERKFNLSFDKKVDKKLTEIIKKGGAVITSYTLPWLIKEDSVIKFWLKGSRDNRAKRMANRDDINMSEAEKIIKLRDEENLQIYNTIYKFKFGKDLSVFDYVLNTDKLSLASLIEVTKLIIRRHVDE